MTPSSSALAALAALALLGAEAARDEASRTVRERFERVGRSAPVEDPALGDAAAALATAALVAGPTRAAEAERIAAAVAEHGGYDFEPRAILLRTPLGGARAALARSEALTAEPASAVGVGVASDESHEAVVVLLAQRRLELAAPLPRKLSVSSGARLCATLAPELSRATLFVADPRGLVRRLPLWAGARGERCADVRASVGGRHTLQLVAEDAGGPTVLALFEAVAEEPGERAPSAPAQEPVRCPSGAGAPDEGEAQSRGPAAGAEVLERIQALRAHHRLPSVRVDERLQAAGRRYAALLAHTGVLAHVGPDGSTLSDRLAAVGFEAGAVSENLARAGEPLAAQANLERSPAHRANLLDPAATRVGVGLAWTPSGAVVLVELLAHDEADLRELPPRAPGRVRVGSRSPREEARVGSISER